jgi:hypothetical protein
MLANIYLRQKGLMPVKWQENLLASENPKRSEYIQALKKADNRDYTDLIEMHKITYYLVEDEMLTHTNLVKLQFK